MKKLLSVLAFITIFAVLFTACEERTDLVAPGKPNTGTVDFTRFVSIGNSLTAGFQSNALFKSGQDYAFGYQIAQQVGTPYTMPFISDPGIGGRIEVQSIDWSTSPPKVVFFTQPLIGGAPLNAMQPTPYNDLGVPGAFLFDIEDTTDFAQKSVARRNPFFAAIPRQPIFGNSILKQAFNLQPTFMTVWIGNNDILIYAASGGTQGPGPNGGPTDPAVFAFLYESMVTKIAARNIKAAFGNIPDVRTVPFFSTVGPQMARGIAYAKTLNPAIVGLFYQKADYSVSPVPTNLDAVNDVLITLTGSAYAPLLGRPTGKFYSDNGLNPAVFGVDTTQPFGFSPANPWPNALILDLDELVLIDNYTTQYNATISALVATNPNFVLIDFRSLLNEIRSNDAVGTVYDGITFRTSFLSGGLFSLDGIHLTSQGDAIVANEFIKAINTKWGASIPLINIATVPGSIFLHKSLSPGETIVPVFAPHSFDNLFF